MQQWFSTLTYNKLTHIATKSIPIVSYLFKILHNSNLDPTPSVEATNLIPLCSYIPYNHLFYHFLHIFNNIYKIVTLVISSKFL